MDQAVTCSLHQVRWNKCRLVGQKLWLKRREIWAIRIRLLRAMVLQRKTGKAVQFELAEQTSDSVQEVTGIDPKRTASDDHCRRLGGGRRHLPDRNGEVRD